MGPLEVAAAIAAIVGLAWAILAGQRTLPDVWRGIRDRLQTPPETSAITDEALSQEAVFVTSAKANLSTVLHREDGRLTTIFPNHDGTHLAFGGFSQKLGVIEVNSGRLVSAYPQEATLRSVRFHPFENAIASGTDGGVVVVFYPDLQEFRFVGVHDGPVYSVAFHPKGRLLASAGKDGTVRLWEIEKAPRFFVGNQPVRAVADPLATFRHPEGCVFMVDFDPSGTRLVSAGIQGAVRVWNLDTTKEEQFVAQNATVFCARFDPRSRSLAASCADGSIRVWDLSTGQSYLLTGHADTVRWLAYHPSGDFLASGSKDRTVRLWNLASKECWVLQGHTDYVYALEFLPGGQDLVSCAGDGTIRRWSITSRLTVRSAQT